MALFKSVDIAKPSFIGTVHSYFCGISTHYLRPTTQ
jgi:hypothetical protein